MKPRWSIVEGDCVEVLKRVPDGYVDAVVTDPPYSLKFMGASWDDPKNNPATSVDLWREVLRVLKPGAHVVAFGGTRTYHRIVVAMEDAGFQIRDSIHWITGQGFPKSVDVGKAIDKCGGNSRLIVEIGNALKQARERRGISIVQADRMFCGGSTNWSWYEGRPAGQHCPTDEVFAQVAEEWPELKSYAEAVAQAEREVIGQKTDSAQSEIASFIANREGGKVYDITKPATDLARQFEGYGSALKPAHEPIVLARRPLIGTIAQNVEAFGTGGINVDGCRVQFRNATDRASAIPGSFNAKKPTFLGNYRNGVPSKDQYRSRWSQTGDIRQYTGDPRHDAGRWPPNVVLTHSSGCVRIGTGKVNRKLIDATARITPSQFGAMGGSVAIGTVSESIPIYNCAPGCPVAALGRQSGERRGMSGGGKHRADYPGGMFGGIDSPGTARGDTGTATRFFPQFEWDDDDFWPFFYAAKTSRAEREAGCNSVPFRNERERKAGRRNVHPTVKPLALMRWLLTLVAPPGDPLILDPFAGSGTTIAAAKQLGIRAAGIELDPHFCRIARARLKHYQRGTHAARNQ